MPLESPIQNKNPPYLYNLYNVTCDNNVTRVTVMINKEKALTFTKGVRNLRPDQLDQPFPDTHIKLSEPRKTCDHSNPC